MYIRDARGSTALGLSRKSGHPLKHLTREEVEVLDFTEASKDELAVPPGKHYSIRAWCCRIRGFDVSDTCSNCFIFQVQRVLQSALPMDQV